MDLHLENFACERDFHMHENFVLGVFESEFLSETIPKQSFQAYKNLSQKQNFSSEGPTRGPQKGCDRDRFA